MTASCLSTPLAPFRPIRSGSRRSATAASLPAARCRAALASCGGRALLVVLALLGAALLLAPEQPIAQADICARHNGSAACRVW